MSDFNFEIWNGKKFSDILQEIWGNQQKKSAQINALILELKPFMNTIGDAKELIPLIAEYMEIGVSNDKHLIDMASIIQRIALGSSKNGSSNDLALTDEERTQLEEQLKEELEKTSSNIPKMSDIIAKRNEHKISTVTDNDGDGTTGNSSSRSIKD